MASQWRSLYPPRAARSSPFPSRFYRSPPLPARPLFFPLFIWISLILSATPRPPFPFFPPSVTSYTYALAFPPPPFRPSDSSILPPLSFSLCDSLSVSLLSPALRSPPSSLAHPRNRPLSRPGHANFLRDKSRGSKLDPDDYRLEPPLFVVYRCVVHEVPRTRSRRETVFRSPSSSSLPYSLFDFVSPATAVAAAAAATTAARWFRMR